MIQLAEINTLGSFDLYRNRMYDPALGRFLSVDPDAGTIYLPSSLKSKYTYVANNSQNFVDPSGSIALSFSFAGNFVTGGGSLWGYVLVGTYNRLSKEDQALLQTTAIKIAIIAAAAYLGGAAAGAFASGPVSGFFIGAAVGGVVGGAGYELFGVGSFQEGFIAGAIAGGFAGYQRGAAIDGQCQGRSPAGLPLYIDVGLEFLGIPDLTFNGENFGIPLNVNEAAEVEAMRAEKVRESYGYKEAPYQPTSRSIKKVEQGCFYRQGP